MTIKVNKIWSYRTLVGRQGFRTYNKPEYKAYIEEISYQLDKKKYKGDLAVKIKFNCINRVVGDLDNIAKPILDILQMNKIIKDDRQILKLYLEKGFGHKENTIEIYIKEL